MKHLVHQSLLRPNHSNDVALITATGDSISYEQLKDDASKVANSLKPNSLIFLVGLNDYILVLYYLASFEHNHVALLLPSDIQEIELIDLLKIYQPNYLLLHPGAKIIKSLASIQLWVDKLPYWQIISSDSNNLSINGNQNHGYQLWGSNTALRTLNKDLAFLALTSGSTGAAKLVRFSRKNLLSNAAVISEYLHLGPDERAILHLPLNYSFGLSILNSHLFSGGSVVLSKDSMMSKTFWHVVNEHSVTSLSGVPYHYEMLLKLKLEKMDLGRIRVMTQAGGALSVGVTKKISEICSKKDIQFYVMYGQTEASPRISYVPPHQLINKLGSIGIPVPGGKMSIRDSNGAVIKESGIEGELFYEGPNVCLGYANNAQELKLGDKNNGILSTGDQAYADADGYFFLNGRLKRFLKIHGVRVSLDKIESMLKNKSLDGIATGKDDHLSIYSSNISADQIGPLRIEIAEYIGIHFSSISITKINNIPLLASGKVDYQCLHSK